MTIHISINEENPTDLFVTLAALLAGQPKVTSSIAEKWVEEAFERRAVTKPTSAEEATAEPAPTVEAIGTELDAHGHPWTAGLHASTKGKTKEGLWRMAKGAERPDPAPGFPMTDAAAAEAEPEATSESAPSAGEETAPVADTSFDEDDEFAAFRDAGDTAEVVVPARTWTDADMSKLTGQAAVKMGDARIPELKARIADFVPEGSVPHSRNVPANLREECAAAIEELAGIEFAG